MVQTVRRTTEIPQFFFDNWYDAPVMQVLQVSQVDAIPVVTPRLIHGPDHRDTQVA